LRLFQFSPVQEAVDLAVRAFPIVRPRPKLQDDAPLTVAMPSRALAGQPPVAAPFAAMSTVLLLAFGSAAAWARGDRRGVRAAPLPVRPILAVAPPVPATPMLVATRITKRFGRFTAVDGINLQVSRGEALALWGPNGAGKSTLLKSLLGLLRFEGTILVDGHDAVKDAKAARGRLGYVPQELAFYPEWTGRELLAFLARIKRVEAGRVDAALAEVGLSAHGAKPIGSLSGGMKQRLALAAALLSDPPLLVLDEITSNLDAAGREGLLRVLARLKGSGKTIVFTSHRRDDVVRLADRVIVLDRGRVARESRPEDVSEPDADGLEDLA
jgi:ABC-type multidrug transport system ATPase subunit